eukprot:TRINITY_DN363_c1_g1_i1.p1 TRINITY_DN363_c1_g1~~TRINITY_DN363_c1_g1_i1.p1  ORF type:complete len:291 (-),score=16.02 TRINITY_DN363_c1_g1_i1:529-1401(-)
MDRYLSLLVYFRRHPELLDEHQRQLLSVGPLPMHLDTSPHQLLLEARDTDRTADQQATVANQEQLLLIAHKALPTTERLRLSHEWHSGLNTAVQQQWWSEFFAQGGWKHPLFGSEAPRGDETRTPGRTPLLLTYNGQRNKRPEPEDGPALPAAKRDLAATRPNTRVTGLVALKRLTREADVDGPEDLDELRHLGFLSQGEAVFDLSCMSRACTHFLGETPMVTVPLDTRVAIPCLLVCYRRGSTLPARNRAFGCRPKGSRTSRIRLWQPYSLTSWGQGPSTTASHSGRLC